MFLNDGDYISVVNMILQNAFGDLYIPEDFEPPTIQKISQLSRRSHDVGSESIEILDAKTLRIPELNYNGAGKGLDAECGSWETIMDFLFYSFHVVKIFRCLLLCWCWAAAIFKGK